MNLYGTAQKDQVSVQPLDGATIKIYTCGPTVYLDPHIGNWRMFIFYDVLSRTLRQTNHKVEHVMNITDVGHLVSDGDDGQDKLEKSAQQQNTTAWDVAAHYTGVFLSGMQQLNMLQPEHLTKATDYIDEQIALVKTLEDKGYTYTISDGVYFDTSKFADYGKMAQLNNEGLQEGARVEVNSEKRNPQDFALWKLSPKDAKRDMEWESPWGTGFPGWHVECSAMASALLGEQIDIHAGGIDHIPVHHTNEIAQSEAAFGKQFAQIWAHGSFMNVDGKKMSKSLGNIYTLEDLADKGFDPLDFRMLVLQAHYRTHQNFTFDVLTAAKNRRMSLQSLADQRFQADKQSESTIDFAAAEASFIEHMQNDIDTPKALSVIAEVEHAIEKHGLADTQTASFNDFLQTVDAHLGLTLLASSDLSADQKKKIAQREVARSEKDFATSDAIRDELAAQGIELNDTGKRTTWRRI